MPVPAGARVKKTGTYRCFLIGSSQSRLSFVRVLCLIQDFTTLTINFFGGGSGSLPSEQRLDIRTN